jgi:hypothetical protein
LATLATTVALAVDDKPAPKPPADFRLVINLYGVRAEPLNTTEIFVWKGRAFRVMSDTSEVVVYDPNLGILELLDLQRSVHADVSMRMLDQAEARLRKSLTAAIAKREAAGKRADRIEAEMSRHLLEPNFKAEFDAERGHLHLSNPVTEIDMTGAPDDDTNRLTMIADSLVALTKLGSMRDPSTLPPFTRIDAVKALVGTHHLRPTEMTVIYRLAGPPKKYRWTYSLLTKIANDEYQTLAKLSAVLERSKPLRFNDYERDDDQK